MDDMLEVPDATRKKRKSIWYDVGDADFAPILPYHVMSKATNMGEDNKKHTEVEFVTGARCVEIDGTQHSMAVTRVAFSKDRNGFCVLTLTLTLTLTLNLTLTLTLTLTQRMETALCPLVKTKRFVFGVTLTRYISEPARAIQGL